VYIACLSIEGSLIVTVSMLSSLDTEPLVSETNDQFMSLSSSSLSSLFVYVSRYPLALSQK
jgi:hypothetical protein